MFVHFVYSCILFTIHEGFFFYFQNSCIPYRIKIFTLCHNVSVVVFKRNSCHFFICSIFIFIHSFSIFFFLLAGVWGYHRYHHHHHHLWQNDYPVVHDMVTYITTIKIVSLICFQIFFSLFLYSIQVTMTTILFWTLVNSSGFFLACPFSFLLVSFLSLMSLLLF